MEQSGRKAHVSLIQLVPRALVWRLRAWDFRQPMRGTAGDPRIDWRPTLWEAVCTNQPGQTLLRLDFPPVIAAGDRAQGLLN